MLTYKKLLLCLVSLVLVVSLAGCGEKTGSLTAPQSANLTAAKPAAPAGQTLEILGASKTNMYVGRNNSPIHEEGVSAWTNDFDVTFGDVKNEFWAYVPAAGDYMIGYHVTGGATYYVFFGSYEPVTVHIGLLKGDYVDAVTIYSGFTYTDADWDQMTYNMEGVAWFFAPYGIVESDESIVNAVALYMNDSNTVANTYTWQ